VLLLNAGHEASVNGLGNGVLALLRHPDQIPAARRDPGRAVEEMLRYDSPLHLFVRTAARDVTVAGTVIPAGAEVAALIGAANRDPAVFPDPDRFDVSRDPNPHLSFGAGLHFCLGAPLARLELTTALTALLAHAPDLTLAADPGPATTFVLRGRPAIRLRSVGGRVKETVSGGR
jgi:cytochrome P450